MQRGLLSFTSTSTSTKSLTNRIQLYSSMSSATTFYDLKAPKNNGTEYDFKSLEGKVVLIANTASLCGFTPQYTGLEALHQKYKDQGLVILGFPSDNFGGQELGTDAEVESFCTLNHGVTFPLMKKSDVNGDNTNEVFKYLKDQKKSLGMSRIKWNFEKFLIGPDGKVVDRYSSLTKPESIAGDIEKQLAKIKA